MHLQHAPSTCMRAGVLPETILVGVHAQSYPPTDKPFEFCSVGFPLVASKDASTCVKIMCVAGRGLDSGDIADHSRSCVKKNQSLHVHLNLHYTKFECFISCADAYRSDLGPGRFWLPGKVPHPDLVEPAAKEPWRVGAAGWMFQFLLWVWTGLDGVQATAVHQITLLINRIEEAAESTADVCRGLPCVSDVTACNSCNLPKKRDFSPREPCSKCRLKQNWSLSALRTRNWQRVAAD